MTLSFDAWTGTARRSQGILGSERVAWAASAPASWRKRKEKEKGEREGRGGPRVVDLRDRPRQGLDLAAIAPEQVERIATRRQGDVVARHAELVAFIDGVPTTDVGPVDPVRGATGHDRGVRPTRRR